MKPVVVGKLVHSVSQVDWSSFKRVLLKKVWKWSSTDFACSQYYSLAVFQWCFNDKLGFEIGTHVI